MQAGPSKVPFNLKLFDSIEIPQADPDHNIIFVTCVNAEDGVGDLTNMKDLGEAIRKIIAGKGYKLCGIAAIGELGKKYVDPRKSELDDIFDIFYTVDRGSEDHPGWEMKKSL